MIRWVVAIVLLNVLLCSQGTAQTIHEEAVKLYEQGENASHANHFKEALTYLNACLKLDPLFVDAYFTRGSVREQLQDPKGALTDYNLYLELQPDHPEALLARALLRFKLSLYSLARDDFQKLLTTPSGETTTIFYRQGPHGRGTDKIMTIQGNNRAYLFNYLALCEAKRNNHQQAIIYYDSAIRLEPNEADYYVNRGLSREGLNDPAATADYERALALRPNHSLAQHNLALLSSKQGDAKTLESKLTEILENDSTMLYAYIERGYQRMESGFYKGALEDYNQAIEIDSIDAELWLSRGLVKEKLKDYSGAYSDYTNAILLKEDAIKAWLNRGNTLLKLARYKEAIDDYTAALTYQPDYAPAYYNRSIARQRIKLNQEACFDLLKAEALGMEVTKKMKQQICGSD